MTRDLDQDDLEPRLAHQVTWFAPDRPVEGQTIFVRPTEACADESAESFD